MSRTGTWLVAIALCAIVVIHAVAFGVGEVTTALTGAPATPWPLAVLAHAGTVALVVGAILLAVEKRRFVVAAIAAAAPLAATVSPYAHAGTAIAAAVLVSSFEVRSRRLSITTYVAAVLYIAALVLGRFAIIGTLALCVLTCYVALSELGAFREATDRPDAQIANRTRTGVTAVSYVFCLIGIALLALVVWRHRNVGTTAGQALVGGVGVFAGGAVALRRLQMVQSRIRNVIWFVLAVSAGTFVVLANDKPRPDRIPLVAHEVFGVRVSLPAGYVTRQTESVLEIHPHHTKFGPVTLRRRRGPTPADKVERFGAASGVHDEDIGVRVRWTCHPTVDFVEVELVLHGVNTFNSGDHDRYMSRLVERIDATFSCVR